MFNFPPKITKEYILSKVSQEDIFEKFGVPITNKKFYSPLREANTPSCGFLINSDGSLILNDFARGAWDCFNFVKELHQCSYFEAMLLIVKEFELNDVNIQIEKKERNIEIEKKEKSLYSIIRKPFTQKEKDFWSLSDWTSNEKLLNHYNIWSISDLFLNKSHIKGNLEGTFAYKLSNEDFQIYSPFSNDRSKRFRSSSVTGIFGISYLKKDKVIICKSYKDFFYTQLAGFNSCCVIREKYKFSEEEIKLLKTFSNELYIYFDNDLVGLDNSQRESLKWGLKAIFNTEEKDYSDFCKKYGLIKAKEMLNELLK